jgi:hypothetical protein
MKPILPFIALLLATGCAFHSENPARNEANEPLMHTSDYLALGAQARVLSGGQVEVIDWRGDLAPVGLLEVGVNRWSSYNWLPINWNFLLSGEQYDDSTHLKVGKFHAIATGGLLGFAYTSADGFMLPANLNLVGKYLFTPRVFATANIGGSTADLIDPHGIVWTSGLEAGFQIWEPVSVGAENSVLLEQLSKGWSTQRDNVLYLDGDISLYSGLTLKAYPTPHHILEFVGGYRRKNPSESGPGQPIFRTSYRYVF